MESERDRMIRERAYALWVEGGRQDGEADRHWATAEAEYAAGSPGDAPAAKARSKAAPSRAATSAKGSPTAKGSPKAPSKAVDKPAAEAKTAAKPARAKTSAAEPEPAAKPAKAPARSKSAKA